MQLLELDLNAHSFVPSSPFLRYWNEPRANSTDSLLHLLRKLSMASIASSRLHVSQSLLISQPQLAIFYISAHFYSSLFMLSANSSLPLPPLLLTSPLLSTPVPFSLLFFSPPLPVSICFLSLLPLLYTFTFLVYSHLFQNPTPLFSTALLLSFPKAILFFHPVVY